MAGYGNPSMRMSQGVYSPLNTSCFAITDWEDNTVILMSMDLQRGSRWETLSVRKTVNQRWGIPNDMLGEMKKEA